MYSEEPSLRRLKCTEVKTGQRRQAPALDVLSIASFIHGVGPITRSRFLPARVEGETGITPPHAGWRGAQKILVLVTLMPHMQNGQGQNHPLLFCNFFIMSKSYRKAYFMSQKLGSLARKLTKGGLDIFFNFLTLKTF
jgi:hypothetical protein